MNLYTSTVFYTNLNMCTIFYTTIAGIKSNNCVSQQPCCCQTKMYTLYGKMYTLYGKMYTLYGKMYTLYRPRKAKKCLRACAKCADSHHLAHTKSQPGIRSPLKHSIICSDFVCGQWKPWSDCAHAQSYLGRRCLHMPKDMCLHGTAHTD